jgi:hypothetical protein
MDRDFWLGIWPLFPLNVLGGSRRFGAVVFALLVLHLAASELEAKTPSWGAMSSSGWSSMNSFDERSRPSAAPQDTRGWRLPEGSEVTRLQALISLAESPQLGYDAVHNSARRKPPKRPTAMTLAEIFRWIEATPRQHHAIGFYQFIPKTLRRLVAKAGLPLSARFTPRLQDRLGDILMAEAGYQRFRAGRLSRSRFMDNLALIWAGLPMRNGKSAYHGHAGNRATISRVFFEARMREIFGPEKRLTERRGQGG